MSKTRIQGPLAVGRSEDNDFSKAQDLRISDRLQQRVKLGGADIGPSGCLWRDLLGALKLGTRQRVSLQLPASFNRVGHQHCDRHRTNTPWDRRDRGSFRRHLLEIDVSH